MRNLSPGIVAGGDSAIMEETSMSDACDFIIENGILKEYVGDSEVVIVPEEVVRIGDRAFSDREDITDVELPDGVTSIGDKSPEGESRGVCC